MTINEYIDPLQDQYHILNTSRGLDRLEKLGTSKRFPAHYIFDYRDRVPERFLVLKHGKIQAFEDSYEGEHRVYNIMYPGSIIMEEYVLFPKPCPILFETATECDIIQIERCDLIRAMKKDVDIALDLLESVCVKFTASMEDHRVGPRQKSEWKICRMILSELKSNGVPYKGGVISKERLSHQTIADLLGLNRVTVTRKMNNLVEMGLVAREKGYLYVPNISKLHFYMEELEKK